MENLAGTGYTLSPQQKEIRRSQPEGAPWNAAALVLLEGDVALDRLQQAFSELVSRHEPLRTVYRGDLQVVLPSLAPVWETLAASQDRLEEIFSAAAGRQFDLARGPVVYACAATLEDSRTALIVSLPALAADRPSLDALVRELGSIYAGVPPRETVSYAQFAQWQNDLLAADDDDTPAARAFWEKQKATPALALPGEARGLAHATVRSATLPDAPREAILAAFQILLWRLTGQARFHTRVFFAGREVEELAGTLGAVGKYLPVPARFDGDYSFADVVKAVRDSLDGAAGWQEYFAPGDAGSGSVAFEYRELPPPQSHGGVTFTIVREEVCSERFQLKLAAVRRGDSLSLQFHFDQASFPSDTADRWSRHFLTLLAAALADPSLPAARLPLLDADDRALLLVQWNRTHADYPRLCLQQLFEAQADAFPLRPALRCRQELLSYQELNRRANRLAHHLRSLGVLPDSRVGLCIDRSADMIVALLAVLKAGGAFVPLSADNPPARLAQQLHGAVALLTESKFLSQLPSLPLPTLCLDRDRSAWAASPDSNPSLLNSPDHLAYVIYTSGSTGVPKGVAVRHRNLVNYSSFISRRLELDRFPEGLHFATVSTLAADLGNTCIYPALLSGGCLHVIPYDIATDGARFAAYTAAFPVDVLKIVPSHLSALLDSNPHILPRRFLITGGEALSPLLLDRIQGSCEVFNHYGPTETTVGSLTLRLRDFDWRSRHSVPIGRPIANTRVYILDALRHPVPIGVPGELYIAGDGVSAGYLDQPALTAERFLSDPFDSGLMYRTGDLARFLPDGNVEFLGRADDQVKIRGFRIEPGEIEAALLSHPDVQQAAVVARPDPRGDKRLIAYLVGPQIHSEQLRAYLKERLPEPMIPAALVTLDRLPLNANGKLDRQKLPEPEEVLAERPYLAPRTATEESLAAIWREIFRRERIGIDENFFEIGGHSLLVTQVISRVRERMQTEVPMRALFDRPTIQGLAEAVDAAHEAQASPSEPEIMPVSREAYRRRKT